MVRWLVGGFAVVPLLLFAGAQWADQRAVLLPGATSAGHRQIEDWCELCHAPFGGVRQERCLGCHVAALAEAEDSHAPGKFDDPARAASLARIDARDCVACHREHRPEARLRGSVSVAADFCLACHGDVTRERPSHRGLASTSCAATGCHNYHDNRALHAEELRRHLREPSLRAEPITPRRQPTSQLVSAPVFGPDAPAELGMVPSVALATEAWVRSSHAFAGVSCSHCHAVMPGQPLRRGTELGWGVPAQTCGTCHVDQQAGFRAGKHGMRLAANLTAMTPRRAALAMKPEAAGRALGCHSCHGAYHDFDLRAAAAEACAGCHDDPHTRAYWQSRHFTLWERERAGRGPAGSGVSCATCHLPRRTVNGASRVVVEHDQNANLRRPDRMAAEVCLQCHGLGFSLAALADPALVAANFVGQGRPVRTALDLLQEAKR